jgi:hypothetical protein
VRNKSYIVRDESDNYVYFFPSPIPAMPARYDSVLVNHLNGNSAELAVCRRKKRVKMDGDYILLGMDSRTRAIMACHERLVAWSDESHRLHIDQNQ